MARLGTLMADVTRYFRARGLTLRGLTDRPVVADADYFELFVLHELVSRCKSPTVQQTKTVGGRVVFSVALSPSPNWSRASFFEVRRNGDSAALLGIRTGLQVLCPQRSTTAEIDVIVVQLPAMAFDQVTANQ